MRGKCVRLSKSIKPLKEFGTRVGSGSGSGSGYRVRVGVGVGVGVGVRVGFEAELQNPK